MIESWADPEETLRQLAEALASHLSSRKGDLRVVIPGGSTPKRLYRLLARPPFAGRVPWARIQWVLSDERCVPQTHPDSNFAMVREALRLVAPLRLVRFAGELPPAEGAAAANAQLASWFVTEPAWDLVLLGLGEDGHTASLFPGETAPEFGTFPVAPVFHPHMGNRLTLTPKALSSAAEIWFLTLGRSKARAVAGTVEASAVTPRYPATFLPLNRSRWFLDEAAAGMLSQRGNA
jgi:6-phosphogluconolactonase